MKSFRTLVLLAMSILYFNALSAAPAVVIKKSNLIVKQGQGWALVKSNVDAYKTMLEKAGQSGTAEYQNSENYRDKNMLVVTTVQGLITADLPLYYVKSKLASYGYSYPVSTKFYSDGIGPIVLDPELVNNIEAFSSENKFQALGCNDQEASKKFDLDVENKNVGKSFSIGNYVDVNANIGFGASGTASVEIFYKKDRTWFFGCKTKGVDYRYHEVLADMSFVDTTYSLSGTAHYDYNKNLFSEKFRLFRTRGDFWVWIVEFEWALEVGVRLAVDLEAKASATIAYEGKVNGDLDIHWKCVNTNCNPQKEDVINIDYTPNEDLNYSMEVDVKVIPKATIYANADLDIYWGLLDVVEAEVGLVLTAPLRFYGYIGNACSDADGDGTNEHVKGALTDWYAELSAYWKVGILDGEYVKRIQFNILGWEDAWSTDIETGQSTVVLRKHFWFKDWLSPISTIFTPVIGSSSVVPKYASKFNFKPRSCYPFKDDTRFSINWGDGTSEIVQTTTAGKVVSHNWSSLGNKQITVTLLDDDFDRSFGSQYKTTRTVQVTESGMIDLVPTHLWYETFAGDWGKPFGVTFKWIPTTQGTADHYRITETIYPLVGKTIYKLPYTINGSLRSKYVSTNTLRNGDRVKFSIQGCDSSNQCSKPISKLYIVSSSGGDEEF